MLAPASLGRDQENSLAERLTSSLILKQKIPNNACAAAAAKGAHRVNMRDRNIFNGL
jgi:hypothetical protein